MIQQRPRRQQLPSALFVDCIAPLRMQVHLNIVTLFEGRDYRCIPSICECPQFTMAVLKAPETQLLHDFNIERRVQSMSIEDSDEGFHRPELQGFQIARTVSPQLPVVRESQVNQLAKL